MDKLMKLTEYFKEEGFEDRTITSIMNNFKIKTFKKGECILEVQEHTQYVYFTIEGRRSGYLPKGRERTV